MDVRDRHSTAHATSSARPIQPATIRKTLLHMSSEPQLQHAKQHLSRANPRRSRGWSAPSGERARSGLDAVVPDRVRALRTSRGWRQLDLAVAAGWAHATVAAVEAGERRLTLRDAAVLCSVLQVPLVSLIHGAEEITVLGLAPAGGDKP